MNENINSVCSVSYLGEHREDIIRKVESYLGHIPPRPEHLTVGSVIEEDFAAGRAMLEQLELIMTYGERRYVIPFTAVIPKNEGVYPAIIQICDTHCVPNKYQPTEELVERGFAIFSFCATDEATYQLQAEEDNASTLSRAAFTVMRILDYALALPMIDKSKIAVIGHSCYGTAALLASALDVRIEYAISNGSGLYINRDRSTLELVDSMLSRDALNADYRSDMLLSLIAPRHIFIGCSDADPYASAEDERLALEAIAPLYRELGESFEEKCHFHKRDGTHYLSREDYHVYLELIK